MKDIIKQELSIGDSVVVTPKDYRGLVVATIKEFTPKKVRVEYVNSWNYGKPGKPETYLVPSNFLCKIHGKDINNV